MNNLQIIRGDDVSISVTFTDSNGDPVDITGATVFFTAKSDIHDADADAVISKEVTSHDDAANGQTTISIADTDTDGLDGIYKYDIQLKDSSGSISSSIAGDLEILLDVTQRTS